MTTATTSPPVTGAPLPATMRASVLQRAGVIALEERPLPDVHEDEVLVEVAAVGVCGSDVHYYQEGRIGDFVVDHPLVLGHEVSGAVVAVGASVDPARVGELVAIEPQRPCRMCPQCKAGRYNLCPFMEFYATPPVDGAFCQYVTIQADFAHRVPDGMSVESAALLEPLSVGIAAARQAQVVPGSRVLIAGAGPIGIIAAQAVRAFGASEVVVTDLAEGRRERALRYGATEVRDPHTDPVEDLGVDAFVDASGAAAAVRSGIRAVRGGGRVVLVGMGADEFALPVSTIQAREICVSGVFRYTDTWPTAAMLVTTGQVDLDSLVTARFGLGGVEAALLADADVASLKSIVLPQQP